MTLPKITLTISAISLAFAGCNVGPDYKRPEVKTPKDWQEPANAATTRPANLARWWTQFNDPILDSLIDRATQTNLDLRLAQARVREARALRSVTASDEWPTVNIDGSATRQRTSGNTTFGGTPAKSLPGFKPESTNLQAGFDSSWEIDLFGGVRRSVEAADANLQASVEDQRDVLISLLAEVARNYIDLRGVQRRIVLTDENIKSQQDTADLTHSRMTAGVSSELDVTRADAQVATTRAQLPALMDLRDADIHRLSVLLGQSPGQLGAELLIDRPIPPTPTSIPPGLPSDLLRRRPDIRRAERQLAAATAEIGVAVSDFFPKFSLTGSLGLQSSQLKTWGNASSTYWSIGPSVSWPIFDAGKIRSNIKVQDARQDQALVVYERTVLTSLEEVENALSSYQKEQTRRAELTKAVVANQRSVDLAHDLYTGGLTDFFNVLETQRNLNAAQQDLTQSDSAVSANLVALYKALGGGWDPPEEHQAH